MIVVKIRWIIMAVKFVRGKEKIIRSRRIVANSIEKIVIRIDLSTALVIIGVMDLLDCYIPKIKLRTALEGIKDLDCEFEAHPISYCVKRGNEAIDSWIPW
jgi:hypothetical protein